jgi:hypothetical protein
MFLTKRAIRISTKWLVTVAIFLTVSAEAGIGLDFDVPKPPESQLLMSMPISFGGKSVQTFRYKSQASKFDIADFYERFFEQEEFEKILDKEEKKRNKRLLRFKRDNLVVSVAILSRFTQTEIVLAKYIELEGDLPPEELRPSISDSLINLPQEDAQGKDLLIIPRPPDSVRWASTQRGQNTFLVYSTSLTVEEIKDFYKLNMPYQNWELEAELITEDALQAYKEVTGKKSLEFPSVFSDGENIEDIIKDAYVLDFQGQYGRSRITIFPNFVDRKLGSIIQIVYTEPQD